MDDPLIGLPTQIAGPCGMYPSLVPISVKTQLYIGYSAFHEMVEKVGNDLVVRGRLLFLNVGGLSFSLSFEGDHPQSL